MRLSIFTCLFLLSSNFSNAAQTSEVELFLLKSNQIPSAQAESASYDFEGIVKLSNCSGSVVRFENQPLDQKAMILTNGHCVSSPFLGPGEVLYNESSRRRMRVYNKSGDLVRVKAQQILYATMTGTDAGIYQLTETFQELRSKGVESFVMSSLRPDRGLEIDIVSGYWDRGYSCRIDDFVYQLKEGNWIFTDSIRYTTPGCQVIGGTSGSPIIEANKRIVVGVNNTGNESGRRCTMNNPCEVDENGNVKVIRGASYGQQTYQFYSCVNDAFEIDLSKEGCQLARPQ